MTLFDIREIFTYSIAHCRLHLFSLQMSDILAIFPFYHQIYPKRGISMPQHISIRVPWHNHGWDGTVCVRPCAILAYRLVGQHVSDEKVPISSRKSVLFGAGGRTRTGDLLITNRRKRVKYELFDAVWCKSVQKELLSKPHFSTASMG